MIEVLNVECDVPFLVYFYAQLGSICVKKREDEKFQNNIGSLHRTKNRKIAVRIIEKSIINRTLYQYEIVW